MENSHSSLVAYVHPIVVLGISDQWTRKMMNSNDAKPKAIGLITGKREGLKTEIFRSHILEVEEKMDDGSGGLVFDEDFLQTQLSLAKEMFPNEDLLGWYVTNSLIQPDITEIQLNQQLSKFVEHPLFLKFDAESLHLTGHLNMELLETVIDPNDETKTLFRKMPMHFETEASELIALEHMASFSASGDYYHTSASKVVSTLAASLHVLNQRLRVCHAYVKDVNAGKIQRNDKILSDISKLHLRLKALQSHPLVKTDNKLTTSSKQVSSIAAITALYEDLHAVNENINTLFSEPAARRALSLNLFANV
uniref:COP9 signalosome complex subunit 6 n=1 Tax=Panagrolaimus sp. JU765 TaxID=591449 RepID=A0AC34QA80_9BILA